MSAGLEGRLMSAQRAVEAFSEGRDRNVRYEHDENPVRFCRDQLGLNLYPRQATLIKLITCSLELLTDFDREVVESWSQYERDGSSYVGVRGTTPDVLERVSYCRNLGRTTFREVPFLAGRRSSKTATASSVTLWRTSALLGMDDPQAALGLPVDKQITITVVSTTRESNRRDAFGDIRRQLSSAPCFAPFIEHLGSTELRLWTPAQLRAGARDVGPVDRSSSAPFQPRQLRFEAPPSSGASSTRSPSSAEPDRRAPTKTCSSPCVRRSPSSKTPSP
jgi:hypothetical protein